MAVRPTLTLAGLPTFWPITFHLLASYSLMAARRLALWIKRISILRLEHRTAPLPHLRQNPRSAYPAGREHAILALGTSRGFLTLYQCFLTLPSVRFGKVCDVTRYIETGSGRKAG